MIGQVWVIHLFFFFFEEWGEGLCICSWTYPLSSVWSSPMHQGWLTCPQLGPKPRCCQLPQLEGVGECFVKRPNNRQTMYVYFKGFISVCLTFISYQGFNLQHPFFKSFLGYTSFLRDYALHMVFLLGTHFLFWKTFTHSLTIPVRFLSGWLWHPRQISCSDLKHLQFLICFWVTAPLLLFQSIYFLVYLSH